MESTMSTVLKIVGAIILFMVAMQLLKIVFVGLAILFNLIFLAGAVAIAYFVFKAVFSRR